MNLLLHIEDTGFSVQHYIAWFETTSRIDIAFAFIIRILHKQTGLDFSCDAFFETDITSSERRKFDNNAVKDVIRGILEANNVLIQIQKADAETKEISTVKLIDIPLDKIECSDALKKFEAFERIKLIHILNRLLN